MLWWKSHSIIHLFRYANEGSKTTSEQRKHSVSECSCTYISCQIFSKGNSDSVLRLLLEFVMFWGKYVLLFNSNFMWSLWYLKYNISQKWVSQVSHRSLNIRLLLTCFNVCTVCESFYRVVSRYTLAIHLKQTLQRLAAGQGVRSPVPWSLLDSSWFGGKEGQIGCPYRTSVVISGSAGFGTNFSLVNFSHSPNPFYWDVS